MPVVVAAFRLPFLLGCLLLAGCAQQAAAAIDVLHQPSLPVVPEVRSAGGVARLTVRAALDAAGRPAFYWDGREIAPTIRVRPGDRIELHYVNDLPEYCGLGLESDSNLHFHGLSVAPVVHADEVIATRVRPGAAFDYTISIGRDQPPGLYWYHPHPHGLANWEIGNGMAGAIVVEGIADTLPQVAGLREQVIVLRDVPSDPTVAAAEGTIRRPATHAQPVQTDPDELGPPCGIETTAQPTINGLPSATIGIRPGERQLWRIVNASAHRHYDLAFMDGRMRAAGARMQVVALDGVPLGYARGAAPVQRVTHVLLPPAARAEMVVTGAARPLYLTSLCFDSGPHGDVDPWVVLGELIDDRGATALPRVAPPLGLRVPAAYRALPVPAVRRTLRFDEDARGFFIDGAAYRPDAPPLVTARAGTVEEWTLRNDTDEVHAFHVHQVHFVVESVDGVRADPHWRDIVDLPPQRRLGGRALPSTTRILVDFRDPAVRGTFLLHCHIVDHEDGGMMAKVRVI